VGHDRQQGASMSGPVAMSSFKDAVTEQQVSDILAWLKTLR